LKKDFPIEDEWVSFQLRPHTPPEGIPFAVLFPGADMQERYASLNKTGAPLGIRFGERTFLSDSGHALEASEYARDQGKYHSFHERVFRAYFTELLDIGALSILLNLAGEVGLDPADLNRSLEEGTYTARIRQAAEEAAGLGINAVPTFIINDAQKIVGVLPLETFRARLKKPA
jgi:predicted DsbA family dithiol-disulfide isomerase